MTPHEVRIKDLTPSGLRELADSQCTVWAQSVHDPSIIIFLKPEPHELNGNTQPVKEIEGEKIDAR